MEFFEDAFDDEKIISKIPQILPDFSGQKISMPVSSISDTFFVEGIDPGVDDQSLWKALNELQAAHKIKKILKKCLHKFNQNFDGQELNKLGKDEAIRLFFRIFDVTPKNGKKTRPEPDSPEELRYWLKSIFPEAGAFGLKVNSEQLENLLQGSANVEEAAAKMEPDLLVWAMERLFAEFFTVYDSRKLAALPDRLKKKVFLQVFGGEKNQTAPETEQQTSEKDGDCGGELAKIDLGLAQIILDKARIVPAKSRLDGIDVTNIRIFENMPVTLKDHVFLQLPDSEKKIFYGCVMLVNPNTNKVAAVGHIENGLKRESNPDAVAPHLVFKARNMDFEALKRQSVFNIVLVPKELGSFFTEPMTREKATDFSGELYKLEKIHRTYSRLPETERVLCIDFGTSNTTAGTYGANGDTDDSVSLVTFQDVTEKNPVVSELLPTMVYVASCDPEKEPEYLFGFEAKKKLIESDYAPEGSFFFEIKRWMGDMDRLEPIEDSLGNEMQVPRKSILEAYLKYVITIAEQQFKTRFKKLHFTAPVKQKKTFLKLLAKIFRNSNREIVSQYESLDEGMAIVYYNAMKELRNNVPEMDILILDCGGGTTDLANCRCKYDKNGLTNELKITTGFENGDSNFGGNNITFRVLQMLKIKIARQLEAMQTLERVMATGAVTVDKLERLAEKRVISQDDLEMYKSRRLPDIAELRNKVLKIRIPMEDLLDLDENQILTRLDTSSGDKENILDRKNLIYEDFEKAYAEAEKYVPTRFAEYELREQREMVRRNFYYLWQMAEAIKIKFYQTNIVNMDFAKTDAMDTIVDLGDLSQYYLSVRKDGNDMLEKKENPLEHMEITFKEIDRILCADIYTLLNILLDFDENKRQTYCLSGQSCKIALFHNLLKEFIPGKYMRKDLNGHTGGKTGSDTLKKYCIIGSIEYNRDKARGSLKPVFESGKIKHIYSLYFKDIGIEPQDMFIPTASDPVITPILRPRDTTEFYLLVRDKVKVLKNEIHYEVSRREQDRYTLDELKSVIRGRIDLTREILEKGVFEKIQNYQDQYKEDFYCFFALPSCTDYGLEILQIHVKHEDDGIYYYLPRETVFEPYENEELLTFFDGKR